MPLAARRPRRQGRPEQTHIGTSVSPDRRRGNCCWKDHGSVAAARSSLSTTSNLSPCHFDGTPATFCVPRRAGRRALAISLCSQQTRATPVRFITSAATRFSSPWPHCSDRCKMQPFGEGSNGLQGPLAYFLARSGNGTGSVNCSWCRKVSVAAAEQRRPRTGAMPSANDQ